MAETPQVNTSTPDGTGTTPANWAESFTPNKSLEPLLVEPVASLTVE